MNCLSHFVFNHRVCGLPYKPYFALGVVLPDLWLRFSRTRRIRWRAVRAARPTDPIDRALHAGLLNHVAVDRAFHGLPLFAAWQRQVRADLQADGMHPALLDFFVHLTIELALDHQLLCDDPALVDRFYQVVGAADPAWVAQRVGVLAAVDTVGLEDVLRRFVRRRFLRHCCTPAGLRHVVRVVFALAKMPLPPDCMIEDALRSAAQCARPDAVWNQLVPGVLLRGGEWAARMCLAFA